VTRPDQAAKDALNEDSPAKGIKSVFAGAPESHQEVASVALRNPPKNLYRLLPNEDGISEPKTSKEKETNRANLFYYLVTLKVFILNR